MVCLLFEMYNKWNIKWLVIRLCKWTIFRIA